MNAFTVDLEDWFCSHNLQKACPYPSWDILESRVVYSTRLTLRLLRKYNTQATYFVLGWIADRFPDLIREVAGEGHEIASHGYSHRLLTQMSSREFEEDVEHSLEVLTRCTSQTIQGFRSPAFTLTPHTYWAIDVLKKLGFTYDSSIYPISIHPDYGFPNAPLSNYEHDNGLIEIPMSCLEIGKLRIPCSGGGYLRLLPFSLFQNLVRQTLKQDRPLIFYIHPWELDPETPQVKLPFQANFRHYTNLKSTEYRIEKLLNEFPFTTIHTFLKILQPNEQLSKPDSPLTPD